jgi:putative ABC transport system substrate-binding protein
MNRTKKWIALLLALLLVGGLAGSLAETDKPLIGILQLVEHPALDDACNGFKDGLKELGYEDGINIAIDTRNAQANSDMLASIADHFISVHADLVLAIATPAAQTMAGKTETIPILGTAITDYVDARLAQSNEAPGYNVSGTTDLNPIVDQIALIKRMAPDTKTVGLLYTSSEDNSVLQARMAKVEIEKAGMKYVEVTVNNSNDVQQAAQSIVEQCDALYIPTDNIIASSMPIVHEAALAKKIPIFCSEAGQIVGGGTATVGISYYNLGKQTAQMAVDVLFNGADISKMAIQAQTEYEYTINKTMCDAIGLSIPEDLQPFAKEYQ